jgi:hypothetical protein
LRTFRPTGEKVPPQNANGNGNGTGPKVRDRLCQIIRQHKLDPELVKAYAVDYCGTKTLREATREQVENFVPFEAARCARNEAGTYWPIEEISSVPLEWLWD